MCVLTFHKLTSKLAEGGRAPPFDALTGRIIFTSYLVDICSTKE